MSKAPDPAGPGAPAQPAPPVSPCPRSGTAARFGAAAEGSVYFALVDWLTAGRPREQVEVELRREGDELVVTIRVPPASGAGAVVAPGQEACDGGAAALAELLADRARPLGGVVTRLPASTCTCGPRAGGTIVARIPCE